MEEERSLNIGDNVKAQERNSTVKEVGVISASGFASTMPQGTKTR